MGVTGAPQDKLELFSFRAGQAEGLCPRMCWTAMHHGSVRTGCIDGLAVMLCTFARFAFDGFAHVLLGGLGRGAFAHNAPVVAVPACKVSARAGLVSPCHRFVSRLGAHMCHGQTWKLRSWNLRAFFGL